tara:strand:- start:713 stop:913 length:201 start_codon:yes stop_codon:yes gene_type:complete
MKYKNKDGIELQMVGDDSTKTLIREVVSEAIRILQSHNHFDSTSKTWAITRGVDFLEENFDLEENK